MILVCIEILRKRKDVEKIKKILIGLLALVNLSAFAQDPAFMVSYGPIKEQLVIYNYQIFVDSKIPLGGPEDEISERCFQILKQMNTTRGGLHGFLLLNSVGERNGICLIKANINY